MSESLDKELDNMEQVTEGSDPVTKNAKPAKKLIHLKVVQRR